MSTVQGVDQVESVSLRLRTPESTADAAAVASMLHALVVLIEETKERIGDNREIGIRVRPFEKGSLEIPFDLIVYTGVGLLALNSFTSQILKTIQQVVDLKKSLQGNSPENLTKVKGKQNSSVVNSGDSVAISIVQNSQVTATLHQAFVDIEKDVTIEGVQLVNSTNREEIVNISRQEFPYFKYPETVDEEELQGERVRGKETELIIHSLVLVGRGKWKFLHNGSTISASMADESFLRRVLGRDEQFGAGDRLQVRLEIHEKYDASTSAYRITKYVVREVLQHSPPPSRNKKQGRLFDV